MKTFYWHDYETWGTDPSVDRPSQFAGVRTDEDLNVIGEPLVMYCKPAVDIWPNPEACLVTGISPQKAQQEGLPENEFIAKIHRELAQPHTCGAGYNSIRFDDEVTRYTLYRNYFDPYEREWRNGCSRWDIIDMVRLCYALRPDGIEWPVVEGKPSFKLENLTVANGIAHESAHDAYSDVDATIKLARLVRQKKTDLYNYVYSNRSKQKVNSLIDIKNRKPLFHISSKFLSENGCAGLVVPLAVHPVNSNAIIVFNLAVDPAPLAELSVEEIRQRVFTAADDLPDGIERLPIKLIHINKCPVVATPKLLDAQAAIRLKIDRKKCERHWQSILKMDVAEKLVEMYRLENFVDDADPERKLYSGFLADRDKSVMTDLRRANADTLARENFVFEDARLNQMLLRYKARNFPSSLNTSEQAEWKEFVQQRLTEGGRGRLSYREMQEKLNRLEGEYRDDSSRLAILAALKKYSKQICSEFALS